MPTLYLIKERSKFCYLLPLILKDKIKRISNKVLIEIMTEKSWIKMSLDY